LRRSVQSQNDLELPGTITRDPGTFKIQQLRVGSKNGLLWREKIRSQPKGINHGKKRLPGKPNLLKISAKYTETAKLVRWGKHRVNSKLKKKGTKESPSNIVPTHLYKCNTQNGKNCVTERFQGFQGGAKSRGIVKVSIESLPDPNKVGTVTGRSQGNTKRLTRNTDLIAQSGGS